MPYALSLIRPPAEIKWHQNEKFAQNMPDDEWLQKVGDKSWFVLSHDRKFHSEAMERFAITQHGVGCFYIPHQNDTRWIKFCFFVRHFQKMVELAKNTERPFIFDLDPRGRETKLQI